MTVAGKVEIFGNGLMDAYHQAALPLKKTHVNESGMHEEYLLRVNAGDLNPVGLHLSDPGSREEMTQYENVVISTANGVESQIEQLRKLFERFDPGNGDRDSQSYRVAFSHFLEDKGLIANPDTQASLNSDLGKELEVKGSVVYFPHGLTQNGKLMVEKICYFDEALEREILQASEWLLVPKEEQKVFENSHVVDVGLSVGSEMALEAFLKGITSQTLVDPSTLHADLVGRLGVGYERSALGMNKALFYMYQLTKRFPYAAIRVFTDGLTEKNRYEIINSGLLSSGQLRRGGKLIIAEEADGWVGKAGTRKSAYGLPNYIPWHLFMMGDVAHRVTFSHEDATTIPFHGFVQQIDPEGNVYGDNIPNERALLALFASVGGFTGIPGVLLNMFANREIGTYKGASISRVPQSRDATLKAAAMYAEGLHLVATNRPLKKFGVVDLGSHISGDWNSTAKSRRQEKYLQKKLNTAFFGVESLGN